MKVVSGMYRGLIGSKGKLTTDKIHAVRDDNLHVTECGIDFARSEILGVARFGMREEVNCKRCLKKI